MATFLKNSPKVGHDTASPPNLISFMLKSWKPKSGKLPKRLKDAACFEARRHKLSARFPGETLIIPSGHLKVRSNDDHYRFRPGTDFYYLTGNQEADCTLVLVPTGAQGHRDTLFVEPNPGKTDATFFTDRIKGELWEGARLGIPESRALYGVEDTRSLAELESFVRERGAKGPKTTRVLRGFSERTERWTQTDAARDQELAAFLSELRLIKSKEEIRELQSAVDATQLGFEDVIRRIPQAKNERELEGVFWTRARMEGNDVGYGSIVATGAHGCTLHWRQNNGKIQKGDLLLLDAGVEGNSLYTADITRTFPISGKFTKPQLEIYELVLAAQAAALKQVKPGNDFMAPNRAAMEVLAHGLERLGILGPNNQAAPTSAVDALKDENQFYKRYSLHNVSHMLGLDVHDCAQARAENYKYGLLEPGMVLTVEPGLYFQLDDLTVPAKYRGIGIRIEDDVVVTAKGHKNLSARIPSQPKDIERWIQTLWKKKG